MKKIEQTLGLRRLVVISRPFWWVNTGVPFLAGSFLANMSVSVVDIVGFIYFLFAYNLLMYGVNDIYDYESDIKNPRKNGSIDGSVLSLALHKPLWVWMISLNIPFLLYFIAVGNNVSNFFLAVMLFMVFAYSVKRLRFKEIPVIDSLTSAFHYSSPFIFGLLISDASSLYLSLFFSFYAWVAANHAFGALQDIIPDKAAGIASVATKLGPEQTLFGSITGYVIAALLPLIFYDYGFIACLVVSPYLFFVLRCLPDRHNEQSDKYSRYWRFFLYTNYIVGALLTVTVLAIMYNR